MFAFTQEQNHRLLEIIQWVTGIGGSPPPSDALPQMVIDNARDLLPIVQRAAEVDRNEPTALALIDVWAERVRQDAQWGGPEHDDQHSDYDWWRFRRDFEDKIVHGPVFFASEATVAERAAAQRANLVKIAALAVAQIESLDRRGFR